MTIVFVSIRCFHAKADTVGAVAVLYSKTRALYETVHIYEYNVRSIFEKQIVTKSNVIYRSKNIAVKIGLHFWIVCTQIDRISNVFLVISF